MSSERAPKNSWEKTYGYTGSDGKPVDGFFEKKKGEIDNYFAKDQKRVHHDYRDFFGALGVIEGGGDAYKAQSHNGTYHGIYQTREDQLGYMGFWSNYGKSLDVKNMKDFQNNPMAQEAAGLLSFMGTPAGRDSRFRATAKAVDDYDLDSFAKDGGTTCKITFVDKNKPSWSRTVQVSINYASVSAAAHLVGQGAMGKILNSVIAGYDSGTPAKIDINDSHVHDGNDVLFTAYMQLTQGYDMSEVVSAKPSQSFDAQLAKLLEGRKKEITDSLKRTDPYNQILDNANLDAVKKVFKSPATSDSGQENTYRVPGAAGSSWASAAQQPPTGRNPYAPPAGRNLPGPYEAPSTSSPFSAFSYLDLARRPNPLGPIPPTWDPGALPTGQNRLVGDSSMNLPPVWANLHFQYSPSGARRPNPPGQPASAPTGYPARPLPSDSPLLPRTNPFLEPARWVTLWGQPESGGNGSPVPPGFNLLGPWPDAYPEGSPDLLQSGSRNLFGPWPGSYPAGRKDPLYPDIERLLGLPPGAYTPSGQTWPPG